MLYFSIFEEFITTRCIYVQRSVKKSWPFCLYHFICSFWPMFNVLINYGNRCWFRKINLKMYVMEKKKMELPVQDFIPWNSLQFSKKVYRQRKLLRRICDFLVRTLVYSPRFLIFILGRFRKILSLKNERFFGKTEKIGKDKKSISDFLIISSIFLIINWKENLG